MKDCPQARLAMHRRDFLRTTAAILLTGTWARLTVGDSLAAVLKTSVFGYLIGVCGCYFGMTAHGGSEAVGHAATRGVELSTLLVLVSNVVLVRVIQMAIP